MNKKFFSKVTAVLLVVFILASSFTGCSLLDDLKSDYVSLEVTHEIISESKNNKPIYSCNIIATISNNYISDITDGTITLNIPSECKIIEPDKTIDCDIKTGNTKEVLWEIEIPVTSEDQNIEIEVTLSADNINSFNSYDSIFVEGINQNDNRLNFEIDTWKFQNYTVNNIPLMQDDYNALLYPLSNNERAIIKRKVRSAAGGQCYGMASTCIISKVNRYPLEKIDSKASCIHDIKKQKESKSFIGYYYLMQFLNPAKDKIAEYASKNDIEILNELITLSNSVKSGGSPILVCFYGDNWGHAVVAYGNEIAKYENNGINYTNCILIYDNNSPEWSSDRYIYYNENGDWCIPAYEDATKLGLVTNKMEFIDFQNLEQNNKSVYSYITAQGTEELIINSSNGESWNISGAGKISENVVAYYDIGSNSKDNLNIAIKNNGNNEPSYEIKSNKEEKVFLTTQFENYYFEAETETGNSVVMNPEGTVKINGKAEKLSIKITNDIVDIEDPFSEILVSAKEGSNATLSVDIGGYKLSGDDLSNIIISTSNDTLNNTAKISDITDTVYITTESDKMVVKIDEDKNGIFETIIATGKESEIKPYSQGFNFTNLWLYIILGISIIAIGISTFFIILRIKNKRKKVKKDDEWYY